MEDLVRYLNEIVEPTIMDLEHNPTSVRHAFIACVATFHAVDYRAYPKPSAGLRQRYRRLSPEFDLVDKIAHAFKHVTTGNPMKPDLTAPEVISRPPAKWGQAAWNLSRWNDAAGGVTLTNDRQVDILKILRLALEFLRKQAAS